MEMRCRSPIDPTSSELRKESVLERLPQVGASLAASPGLFENVRPPGPQRLGPPSDRDVALECGPTGHRYALALPRREVLAMSREHLDANLSTFAIFMRHSSPSSGGTYSSITWAHLPMARERRVSTAVSNGRLLRCTWARRIPPSSVASKVVARSSGLMSGGSFPSA